MTLEDKSGNIQGITVNLDATSVYADGTYFKAADNDFLDKFVDKDGNGLTKVLIGEEWYYDISGQSVFLISALTCDGMRQNGSGSLNPDGLDLILNLQTMIEIHQAENAQKISYLNYEPGKTAQADAPADPGEAPAPPTEPTPPDEVTDPGEAPTPPTEPTPPDEVTDPGEAPTPPTEPTPPDEVTDPGEAPTPPTEPTPPDEVTDPGEAPAPPTEPTPPDEVTDPGEAPTPPTAPTPPDEVADPGEGPVDPGEFDALEPEAPAPTKRMEHVGKLEELEEKIIVVIDPIDPVDPVVPGDDPVPLDDDFPVDDPVETPEEEVPETDDGLVEILDEEVPLADVPTTGDSSVLFGTMSAFSALGMAVLQLLGRKKRDEV